MASAPGTFLIAQNPDPESTLPYLLFLPLDGGIALKARQPWPSTSRVYCHPADHWPSDAVVVEEVPVRICARRGRAVDLVLDRSRNNRSQFIFTEPRADRHNGRPMIFWQTARTVRRARPGQRAPMQRASELTNLTIHVDSRERYPYRFADRAVERVRSALPCGDYGVRVDEELVATVERKTLEDLVKSMVEGSLAFALADLSGLAAASVVVEARYSELMAAPRVRPGWLAELIAHLRIRYPKVPICFCDSRKLAEDFTHRFLAAAFAEHVQPRSG